MVLTVFWGLSAAILLTCILVHLSTLVGINPLQICPALVVLHIAAYIPFAVSFYYCGRPGAYTRVLLSDITGLAPKWLCKLTIALFIYAFLNFALFAYLMEFGKVTQINGRPTLVTPIGTSRVLTDAENLKFDTYIIRGISGHWMLFSSFGFMALTSARVARKAAAPPRRSNAPAQP